MKWIVIVLTLIGIGLLALGLKSNSSVPGWQDRENAAITYFLAFAVFVVDAIVLIIWGLWVAFK